MSSITFIFFNVLRDSSNGTSLSTTSHCIRISLLTSLAGKVHIPTDLYKDSPPNLNIRLLGLETTLLKRHLMRKKWASEKLPRKTINQELSNKISSLKILLSWIIGKSHHSLEWEIEYNINFTILLTTRYPPNYSDCSQFIVDIREIRMSALKSHWGRSEEREVMWNI